MNWDEYFMKMVDVVASKSKDPSTKVGCVIIGPEHEIRSTGFNGLPRGCDDTVESRNIRPEKYFWYEHSERNSIYNAGRNGVPLKGCKAYISGPPCVDCARALIQSGIIEVIYPVKNVFSDREDWMLNMDAATEMLVEANVYVRVLK